MSTRVGPKGKECVLRLIAVMSLHKTSPETLKEMAKCPGEGGCAQYLVDMGGPRCGLCR